MDQKPCWIDWIMVEAMHYALIREFGGSFGVRDRGAIESALARPKNKWAYGERSLVVLAAAYGFGLCKNHGFVDGNKRIAFVVMTVFLHKHGIELDVPESDALLAMEALATGEWNEARLVEWLGQ